MSEEHPIHRDPENLNRGTPRGTKALAKSIERTGYGRSGVITSDNRIIGGNHLHQVAEERGDDPIIIDVEGDRPVFLRRTDLHSTDPRALQMAILDNRVPQLNIDLDLDRMRDHLQESGLKPSDVEYTVEEISGATQEASVETASDGGSGYGGGEAPENLGKQLAVWASCSNEADQAALYQRLKSEGRQVKLTFM